MRYEEIDSTVRDLYITCMKGLDCSNPTFEFTPVRIKERFGNIFVDLQSKSVSVNCNGSERNRLSGVGPSDSRYFTGPRSHHRH